MADRDVTELIRHGYIDDMPREKCICGAEFEPRYFVTSIFRDDPTECPKCGRKFYFVHSRRVFEIVDAPLESESLS